VRVTLEVNFRIGNVVSWSRFGNSGVVLVHGREWTFALRIPSDKHLSDQNITCK